MAPGPDPVAVSHTGIQLYPLVYVLSMAVFTLQQQSWVVVTVTLWSIELKIFTKTFTKYLLKYLQKTFADLSCKGSIWKSQIQRMSHGRRSILILSLLLFEEGHTTYRKDKKMCPLLHDSELQGTRFIFFQVVKDAVLLEKNWSQN